MIEKALNELMDNLTEDILTIENIRKGLVDVFIKKNADYGNDQLIEFGEFGIVVRSFDKINRLKNLVDRSDRQVIDETLDDTWRDLAIYSFIALLIRKGCFKNVRS